MSKQSLCRACMVGVGALVYLCGALQLGQTCNDTQEGLQHVVPRHQRLFACNVAPTAHPSSVPSRAYVCIHTRTNKHTHTTCCISV
jgi:hypothetical protein